MRARISGKPFEIWLNDGNHSDWIARRTLFQFEFGDFDAGRFDIAYAARRARLLPIEVSEPEGQAAVGLTPNDLCDLAAVDNDTQSGRVLVIGPTDWPGSTASFQARARSLSNTCT